MTVTLFDEQWYHGIINQYSPGPDVEGAAVATCNMVAACIIAQAIDNLAKVISASGTAISDSIGSSGNLE